MNRKKLLALGLTAVMAVSFAIPAFAATGDDAATTASASATASATASSDATASADATATASPKASGKATPAPTATPIAKRTPVSPAKVADVLDATSTKAFTQMEAVYDALPEDETVTGKDYTVTDIFAEGSDIVDELTYEALDHLDLLSWVDSSEDLTNYKLHGSGARLYDNYSEYGISTAFQNTDKSITASYIIGGTPRKLLNIGTDIPLTEDQKKSSFYQVHQMQVEQAKMYAEYTWYRAENRLRVDYSTHGSTTAYGGIDNSTYNLGGVDLVYRGENSIFMQIFYPVNRTRENPEVETYFVARVLLQKDGRTRVSAQNASLNKINRLYSGYPSWNDFKLKNATEWDFTSKGFTLVSNEGKTLYPTKDSAALDVKAPEATAAATDEVSATVDVTVDVTATAEATATPAPSAE